MVLGPGDEAPVGSTFCYVAQLTLARYCIYNHLWSITNIPAMLTTSCFIDEKDPKSDMELLEERVTSKYPFASVLKRGLSYYMYFVHM